MRGPGVSLERYPAPERLPELVAEGWAAVVSGVPSDRDLSRGELVRLEAAARAYARWRRTEEKLEEVAASAGGLAGEFAKDKTGALAPSALRIAAREAFDDFLRLSDGIGSRAQQAIDQFDRDLFGDPIPKKRRGRPPHVPSQKTRDKVTILLALGWQTERIANALHVTLPTLHKHYKRELNARLVQRDRLDAWRVERAAEEAAKGNVGAMRLLDQLIEKNDRALADARLGDRPKESRAEKPGKKVLSAERAASAEDRLRQEAARARKH